MSTESTRIRDEHLIAAMAVVLTSGLVIENERGDARIERAADGQFHVLTLERVGTLRPVKELFDDVREAIRFYLDANERSLDASRET